MKNKTLFKIGMNLTATAISMLVLLFIAGIFATFTGAENPAEKAFVIPTILHAGIGIMIISVGAEYFGLEFTKEGLRTKK